MTFWRMPLLVWANFTTSLLVVIATPFVAGSQFLVLIDRALHANFFDASQGGDVISYQHIFWFYSHPAVYIMMLPGFGIISEVISTKARKPIFGYRLMALSLMAILVLGFTVWAHHMFVSGMWSWLRVPMMITTMLIAVPTGIKIFSWLATLWRGVLELSTPMLFALGFITMFTLGGISGIMLAAIPVDIHTSDSYFVVAHIHYVLFGGSMFTIFAGIYYWFPKMTGRMYDETARQAPLLDDVHRLQRDVRADALDRARGDAAPRRRLRGQVRGLEPGVLDRRVPAGCRDAGVRLQLHRQLGGRPARAPATRGAPARSSGRSPRRRRSSTSTRSRRSWAGRTSTACPGSVHAVLNGDREKVAGRRRASGNGHAGGARQGNGHGDGARRADVEADWRHPDPPASSPPTCWSSPTRRSAARSCSRRSSGAPRGPDPLHGRLPAEHAAAGLRDLRRHACARPPACGSS